MAETTFLVYKVPLNQLARRVALPVTALLPPIINDEVVSISIAHGGPLEESKVDKLKTKGSITKDILDILSREQLIKAELVVLADSDILNNLLYDTLFDAEGSSLAIDAESAAMSILSTIRDTDGVCIELALETLKSIAGKNGIELPELITPKMAQVLISHPLFTVDTEKVVLKVIRDVMEREPIRRLVDAYFSKVKEIKSDIATEAIREMMVTFLIENGIVFKPELLVNPNPRRNELKSYDEHFITAFVEARKQCMGEDPITSISTGGSLSSWNFIIDTSQHLAAQEIISENILAAAALKYIYYLGEKAGIFRMCDYLVLNWAAGALDITEGSGADKLYRYYKLREQRIEEAERGMVYRRVFDFGSADVLSRMVVNEHYSGLWHKLMKEATDYIDKLEKSKQYNTYYSNVSRKPIELAALDLQYNLTEYATGMIHMQARELYAQLTDAIEIFSHEDVLAHYGGKRRKSMWRVIEELFRQEKGSTPNIASIKTLGIEGYNILRWISGLGTKYMINTNDTGFSNFLRSAEAWIISASSDEGEFLEEDEDADEFDDEYDDENEDDFEDEFE